MAMGTDSGIARSARRLKDIATDAVVVPSTEELYQRKCAAVATAKAELARVTARIIEAEKLQPSQRRGYDEMLTAKAKAEATIERLCHEAGLIKGQIIAARPKAPLTPQQQVIADALVFHDPYAKCPRGTAQQIAEAQAAVDALVVEYKLTTPTGAAGEAWTAKSNAARLRLAVLQGPPYAPYRPWASDEAMAAEQIKLGLER